MKWIAFSLMTIFLSACGEYRGTPDKQVEDYAKCTKAGMDVLMNSFGEIRCAPPRAGYGK